MQDFNHVGLIGRLVKDSELSTWNNSDKLDFCLAWNTTRKSGNEWGDESNFINLTLWGKVATTLTPRLKKGVQVAISGRLKQNRWEKDGQKYSAINVQIENIQIIGGQKKSETATNQNDFQSGELPEDIPF